MTPSALTPAARGAAANRRTSRPAGPVRPASVRSAAPSAGAAPAAPSRPAGHRARLERSTTPHAPRRVSGPARPSTAPRPRRTTRTPARPATRSRSAAGSTWAPLGARSLAFVRALPDHALLDRIIRGRAWIPLLGALLAGIVFMQVEVLKLNAGIGRSLQQATTLQAQNEMLRASVAGLADDQRIEALASQMGMVMPAPQQIKFLSDKPAAAIAAVHAPDGTAFAAQIASQEAAIAASAPAASSTSSSPTSTATTAATAITPSPTGAVTAPVSSAASTVTPATTTASSAAATAAPVTTTPATTTPATAVPTGSTQSGGSSGGASPVGG